MYRIFVSVALLFIPNFLFAAVTIHEVAWMGSTESANNEWIELHNDGSSVSVDGWTLSDGQNLEIDLAGAVGAGQYAVLERTDDSSAPGSAFLVYTGALGNDGRTLTLKRSNGSIADQVVGGENWQNIGGDNVTKETAQYTSSGWVTGVATPGSKNVTTGSVPDTEDETETTPKDDSPKDDGKNVYISLVEPDNDLTLTIEAPITGYVHQPIMLTVTPTGLGDRIMDSLQYTWNFGNLATSSGTEVQAWYSHPGTYVIVVEATYAKYVAKTRHTITIVPTSISLIKNPAGDILIQNNAQYEVDVSGFSLKGNKAIIFPEYTFLAPKATMVVPQKRIAMNNSAMVMLYDRAKEAVATSFGTDFDIPSVTEHVSAAQTEIIPVVQASTQISKPTPTLSTSTETNDKPQGMISATTTTNEIAAGLGESEVSPDLAAVSTAGIPNDKLPYLGLMGLITLGILTLYGTSQKEQPFGLR